MMNPIKCIVHFSGPSCTGKSTLAQSLQHSIPDMYRVSFDKLKWQLAGYDRIRHRDLLQNLTFGLLEVVCRQGLPIALDTGFDSEEQYRSCLATAEKYGYTFLSIALTAPREVLLVRFRQRVASARRSQSAISITEEKDFLQNLARVFFQPPQTIAFDTSVDSLEYMTGEILQRLTSPKDK